MVTLQIVKSLRFGELAINSNSPIFRVVKISRVSRNFIQNVVYLNVVYLYG